MRARSVTVVSLVLVAVGLTGCAVGQIVTQSAPNAADPLCAQVLLSVPEELGTPGEQGSLGELTTTAQGTTAWGNPTDPVMLHCGVEVPGPTTDSCTTVSDENGAVVDWITRNTDEGWIFTSYGRSPAVQLTVPASAEAAGSEYLIQLGPAVAPLPISRTCL